MIKKTFALVIILFFITSVNAKLYSLDGTIVTFTAFTIFDKSSNQIIHCTGERYIGYNGGIISLKFDFLNISGPYKSESYLHYFSSNSNYRFNIGNNSNTIEFNGFITDGLRKTEIRNKIYILNNYLYFMLDGKGIFTLDIAKKRVTQLTFQDDDLKDFAIDKNQLYLLYESKIKIAKFRGEETFNLKFKAKEIDVSEGGDHLIIKGIDSVFHIISLKTPRSEILIEDAYYVNVLRDQKILKIDSLKDKVSFINQNQEIIWEKRIRQELVNDRSYRINRIEVFNNQILSISKVYSLEKLSSKSFELFSVNLETGEISSKKTESELFICEINKGNYKVWEINDFSKYSDPEMITR